jgi:hypothetical protein
VGPSGKRIFTGPWQALRTGRNSIMVRKMAGKRLMRG